jgi:hypothetical protein
MMAIALTPGHVIHYALYLYDSHRSEPLESLDDVVYYLKASIHSLELISALFVVGAGIKDGFSGDWYIFTQSYDLDLQCQRCKNLQRRG